MLTHELKSEIYKYFTGCYSKYLYYVYKGDQETADSMNKLYEKPEVKNAYSRAIISFFEATADFYRAYPNGNYIDELNYAKNSVAFKSAITEYEQLSGDSLLSRFLQVYSYCVQESSDLIYTKKYEVVENLVPGYFQKVEENCLAMFDKLVNDINKGNYWWLKNTATSLRRQLGETITVFSERRFNLLCEKYFDRKIDVRREFVYAKNPGSRLIPELDRCMSEYFHAKPYYCWKEKGIDGETVTKTSEFPPFNAGYTYIAYFDKHQSRDADKNSHYL